MPKQKLPKKLSKKQTDFIYYYMISGNATDACRRAGYKGNEDTLAVVGSENLRKPYLMAEIDRLRREAGISPELAAQRHKELIDAETTVFITTQTQTKKGKQTTIEVPTKIPDKAIRLGALNLYYKKEGKLVHKVDHSGKVEVEHHLKENEIGGIFENIRKANRLGILNIYN